MEIPLKFEHYEERQQLSTAVLIEPLEFTVDGQTISTVDAQPFPGAVPNPYIDGPGPDIDRYQGTDDAAPHYDPARAGQIIDGFDKAKWFAAQTVEIKMILLQSAVIARIDHGTAP